MLLHIKVQRWTGYVRYINRPEQAHTRTPTHTHHRIHAYHTSGFF